MRVWLYFADVILIVHLVYIVFIILGLILIAIGALARWRWIRSPWFRVAHLSAILVPLIETAIGLECPLTSLENLARMRAGQAAYGGSFVVYWLRLIIFHDWPPTTFAILYATIAVLILASFVLIPPELPMRLPRLHRQS